MDKEDMQIIVFGMLFMSILVFVILIAQIIPMNMNVLVINVGQSLNLETLIISMAIVCFILAIGTVFLSLSE